MSSINIHKLNIKTQEKELLDISFEISSSTALIGQSGSGKSLTLKAILNLLPTSLIVKKEIKSSFDLNPQTIGFIPQNPFTSLSPMTKIRNQFFCSISKIYEVLELVDIDKKFLDKFPSQLSGGQIQRIIIAIALSKDTKLLLLDEPTTALDIANKENIIKLVKTLIKKLNILILFVTHDIESIKGLCEDIIIINNGKIIEEGKTEEVLLAPKNTYTKKLINSTFKNKVFRK